MDIGANNACLYRPLRVGSRRFQGLESGPWAQTGTSSARDRSAWVLLDDGDPDAAWPAEARSGTLSWTTPRALSWPPTARSGRAGSLALRASGKRIRMSRISLGLRAGAGPGYLHVVLRSRSSRANRGYTVSSNESVGLGDGGRDRSAACPAEGQTPFLSVL